MKKQASDLLKIFGKATSQGLRMCSDRAHAQYAGSPDSTPRTSSRGIATTFIILVPGKENQKDSESRASFSTRQVVDQPGLHKTLS